ncbi:hypothetical protein HK097_009644 [Rhizophlyctis rosea]|uniref:glutaminase n=1 Tax=Rhizophlyctis rosea TaxID=64517 RepID=A0AAD5X0Y9_9FUNG|nr:hypothetical protein HK097_009644 [Rhizophlyctis rosea]
MTEQQPPRKLRIGVLALQGAFTEHINLLNRLTDDIEAVIQIKTPQQLESSNLDALILPGGESTTMALIAERNGLMEPLRGWVRAGKPVWGTCAGLILLSNTAHRTKQLGQPLIGGLSVSVKRNAFGTQLNSFVSDLSIPSLGPEPFPAVFIRAPIIETLDDPSVEVLARVTNSDAGGEGENIVAVRQGSLLATAFHPELTADDRFHRYYLEMVREVRGNLGEGVNTSSS